MPYLTEIRKIALAHPDDNPMMNRVLTSGELNYKITLLLLAYLDDHTFNYQTLNDIVGAVESAKAEFQRRVVNPYEDEKIVQNGDVYKENRS
jgi:hypothetical protein